MEALKGDLLVSGQAMTWTFRQSKDRVSKPWGALAQPRALQGIAWKMKGRLLVLDFKQVSGYRDTRTFVPVDALWEGTWSRVFPSGGAIDAIGLKLSGDRVEIGCFAPKGGFAGNKGKLELSGATMVWKLQYQSSVSGGAYAALPSPVVSDPIGWKVGHGAADLTLDFKPKDAAPYTLVFNRVPEE